MKKPASHIKRRLLFTLFSWITATVLLFVSYSVTNIGFSISGEADIIKQSNFIFKELLQNESSVPDSILFVNVCYDKQLANIYDEDGFEIGNVDITDRHSLLRFLNILSRRNDYKYVILDVFFEDGIKTEYDSALYARIASMERIVIPALRDAVLSENKSLKKKAYLSDYTTTFFSDDYYKFELVSDGKLSIPYHIYSSITGNKPTSYGIFHFDDGDLCNRTLFAYPHITLEGMYAEDGSRNYYNLGADLLNYEEELLTDKLIKGKYIFIGDMELNDRHETVVGDMPGLVILANTFISLMHRQHVIPFPVKILLFIIYFIFSYQIFSRKSLFARIVEWRSKKDIDSFPFLGFVLSWFTYSLILTFFCIISYYTYGIAYDILITATLLQILDYIVTHSSQIADIYGKISRKESSKNQL